MITTTLQHIAKALNDYSAALPGHAPGDFVTLGNISKAEDAEELKKAVVLSLVNIEEEKTLKNHPLHIRTGVDMKKIRPLLHLNLCLLFGCADTVYVEALKKIDIVIGFFQQQNIFIPTAGIVERVTVEMMSLTFEQQNHLWGVLGGRQVPSVLYKLRLVIVDESVPKGADVIEAIRDNSSVN